MLLKPTSKSNHHLSPSNPMLKTLFFTYKKTPSFLLNLTPCLHHPPPKPLTTHRLSTTAAAATNHRSPPPIQRKESQMERRARRNSPSGTLLSKLCSCSKFNDTQEAIRLYEQALIENIPLTVEHYNKLLYLCSSSTSDVDLKRGFEIYKQMDKESEKGKIVPNEATFTTMARLAAKKQDPETAFELVKRMKDECGISPKLRSYVPALSGFCKKGMAEKAYEVDGYMVENGVMAEEAELGMLLGVSSGSGRGDKVYEMLHRLRAGVRQVGEETLAVIEDWFGSDAGSGVGRVDWDVGKVRGAVLERGGGWHGQGWLGSGKWRVKRTRVDGKGFCESCGEKLVSVDLDPLETENFATSLSALACQRETRADFLRFQEWLQKHGPFDAVVDGANVGYLRNFFDFNQLKSAVNLARKLSPTNRLPLVILHSGRVRGQHTGNSKNKTPLQQWNESGALYVTPQGSNDDWYWLYAAISSKCLLVTNDEMRDHLFALLGTNFFPRWKEKHQVRLSLGSNGLQFHMPPPYSIVIQESEQGRWHIPSVCEDDLGTNRQWLCAYRDQVTALS